MSSWQILQISDPTKPGGSVCPCVVRAAAIRTSTASVLLRMHPIDRELPAGTVADRAALSQRAGIRECVRGGWNAQVAAGARRGDGLDRIDWPLRIDHRIEPQWEVEFAAAHVAQRAVPCVRGRAVGSQRGKERLTEVVVAS